ncbi:hypothetical protein [Leifsonia sp. TF02-11]|uniref:hypothetical protein n=1 Tax=Leifsonia sp. TF02-11 TaxID=2815212 RepID=UPI001AA0CC15|nr:hypothetical protein [Leifsonia sp. TF02-11]MBO1740301.1 hypothetical protein [Leifsonia sp. TF02-11]
MRRNVRGVGRFWWLARWRDDERGVALVMVIGVGAVLMVLVATALAYSAGGMQKARTDQDWNDAMAAAYAGVEEYESRLANDNTYQQYGNPASLFSATSSVTLPTGAQTNLAFGVGRNQSWAQVSGSTRAYYRYEVDNSKYSSTGVLRVRSTGKVGNEVRSIVVNLKQDGFIDFLYFTDYEIQDPALSGVPNTCVKYYWAGRGSGCSEIAFDGGDVVNGPVHSNDAIRICSAEFTQSVTTAYNPATGPRYVPKNSSGSNCTGQTFDDPNAPTYSPVVGMPPTNASMKNEVRSDLPVDVPRPGCLYTGPTSIVYNSNGTMTIRSPWTKSTQVSGSPATGPAQTPAMCGTLGTGTGQLGSPGGATIPVIPQNLVFVQNVPSTVGDPNYWAANAWPGSATGLNCAVTSGTLACKGASGQANGNGLGYPMTNEVAPSSTSYQPRVGDVFIKGTLKGAETVYADNYIYVTGNLTYNDANSDILGLVGNNAIFVYNPMNSSNQKLLSDTDREIDAAILSVAHTFQVQNYSVGGNRGTLTVKGAIAQKFRGIVRNGSNGYIKNYVYDPRFRYLAPPKFLSPVSTSYGVSVVVEVKTAFTVAGDAL